MVTQQPKIYKLRARDIINELALSLYKIGELQFPSQHIQDAVNLAWNIQQISNYSENYNAEYQKLCLQHAKLEKGAPMYHNGAVVLDETKRLKFTDKLKVMEQKKVDMELYMIPMSTLMNLEGITPNMLSGIMPITT